ncbi:small-conductance mechanosensitive channel [Bosea sp. BE271]|uniref:mechanosensitive ion channel family protein n=1 Tax=Bosea TaxID=85413 RepID=UPI00286414FE|nr:MULTISPECIES: mechanosensitive ion channel family protein [Bosea]MDR6830760.1 small-conductance mechanosensitive channel [Bosea robiniae]MDR6895417.1 small-conductance mechanosensitive channel [Bosea sp. BE109]MDR7138813.1 small-conductance mechanosensitive channel [Bosea sp. BE168]MDR7175514.1 small-conductance mechanosensitive channel [Bosea sp. BE271]
MSERSQMRGRRLAHIRRHFSILLGAATVGWVNTAWAEAAGAPASVPMQRSLVSYLAQGFTATRGLLWPILAAIPRIPGEAREALAHMLATGNPAVLLRAACIVALLLLLPHALRLMTSRPRARMSGSGTARLLFAFAFDIGDLVLMMFAAAILAELTLGDDTLVARLGIAFVDIVLRFKIVMTAVRILLRPGEPKLRLVAADDVRLRQAMPFLRASLLLAITFVTIIPLLLEAGMSWTAGQAAGVTVGTIVAALMWTAARRFLTYAPLRLPVREIGFAAVIVAAWAAWIYGVLSLDFPFYVASISIGGIVVGAFIVDRLLLAYGMAHEANSTSASLPLRLAQALVTIVRLAAALGVVLIVTRFLAMDFPAWLGEQRWNETTENIARAAAAIFVAYALSALISTWMRAKFVTVTRYAPGEDNEFQPGSRLLTVIPLLQWGITSLVLGTGILVALGELGVDIAPLLAGAGIFGLALSFGAQSLVRDIISGLFYMADDAFRIGEYIQAGQLKGTVESISLRSVRLRHQHGQVHTVPFGQLGSVSNSSRDWLIVKFNLRLARDVDIEMVRKTVKKIGEELLSDPEFAPEFLEPLKMQGVADIQEGAIVVRFKFTVRPGKPTVIQREALKRIVNVFGERGISFASHAVVVHGAPGHPDAAAGAAAAMTEGLLVTPRSKPGATAADSG